jgi:hypothetical protein
MPLPRTSLRIFHGAWSTNVSLPSVLTYRYSSHKVTNPVSWVILVTLRLPQIAHKFSIYKGTQHFFLSLQQEPAIGSYCEPNGSIPHLRANFKILINIILPMKPKYSKFPFFLRFSNKSFHVFCTSFYHTKYPFHTFS